MLQTSFLTTPVPKSLHWTGRIMSGLAALFLLVDGVSHMLNMAPVVQTSLELGYPVALALGIGLLELVCLALYVVPRTSVLGPSC